jgi:hypothetical protein
MIVVEVAVEAAVTQKHLFLLDLCRLQKQLPLVQVGLVHLVEVEQRVELRPLAATL